jgi:hypothetical protein
MKSPRLLSGPAARRNIFYQEEGIFIELMTSDRKRKASREGSKRSIHGTYQEETSSTQCVYSNELDSSASEIRAALHKRVSGYLEKGIQISMARGRST